MTTVAQIVATLIPDGTYYHATIDGEKVRIEEVCRLLGASEKSRPQRIEYMEDDNEYVVRQAFTRFSWTDGSAIVIGEAYWYVEGSEPWMFEGE